MLQIRYDGKDDLEVMTDLIHNYCDTQLEFMNVVTLFIKQFRKQELEMFEKRGEDPFEVPRDIWERWVLSSVGSAYEDDAKKYILTANELSSLISEKVEFKDGVKPDKDYVEFLMRRYSCTN